MGPATGFCHGRHVLRVVDKDRRAPTASAGETLSEAYLRGTVG